MLEGKASRTAMLVSAWRGLGAYERPVVSRDPTAEQLVPTSVARVLRAAKRKPKIAAACLSLASTLTGGLTRHLPLRTRAIDDALEEEVRSQTDQVVLLGAGLDGRAYRLSTLSQVEVFEVDHPATQAYKRKVVEPLTPLVQRLVYVPVNFEHDDLAKALLSQGFNASRRSTVIWEGVIMYLDQASIEATLGVLAGLCTPGSSLIATYYSTNSHLLRKLAAPLFAAVGEPLQSRMSPAEIGAVLERHGFRVESDEGDKDWGLRYANKSPRFEMAERLFRARRL